MGENERKITRGIEVIHHSKILGKSLGFEPSTIENTLSQHFDGS
ncbi:MAG: hypothetical protein ACFFC7_28870 [Candidatus Hermodarchaeota archaeon]